jgi:hypothetical protein
MMDEAQQQQDKIGKLRKFGLVTALILVTYVAAGVKVATIEEAGVSIVRNCQMLWIGRS